MASTRARFPRLALVDLWMRLVRGSTPETDDGAPSLPSPPRNQSHPVPREDNANPPHNLWKDKISPEERAERIKSADRQYFKATGDMETFYLIYPSDRPLRPEPKPEQRQSAPHNPLKEDASAEERIRRVQEANRQYLKATKPADTHPAERPPEREPAAKQVLPRWRGGRNRGGR